jgi:hypothetical protein
VDSWHDSAGISITVACFFCLWAVAGLITKWSATPVSPTTAKAVVPESGKVLPTLSIPLWFTGTLAAWTAIVLLGTELWYRSGEDPRQHTSEWHATLPNDIPGAEEIPVSKIARSKLKYDHGTTLRWQEPDGTQWSAYYLRWDAGSTFSRMSARDHRPEYCLGGSGYNCREDRGLLYFDALGLNLPFRAYVFERGGAVLYVFHCIWEDGAEEQPGFGSSKYLDRLKPVLNRKRNLGQRSLEIIVRGYSDMMTAENAVRLRLPHLIELGAPPSTLVLPAKVGL